jgi:DNA topoisomerase-1
MPDSLIIVESPTKVKTIKKYVGSDFDVKASVGHVKDLPKSAMGIDIENEFQPSYQIISEKKKVIAELKKSAKKVKNIYLAPDPDREGEAIAWHIAEEIDTAGKNVYRVLFNDLTKNTILNALKNPQSLASNKYEAQQARRILDRLVGYQISPILWDKVKRGLSAGRVQSVAVRIICDREEEISKFVSEEYWNIFAFLEGASPPQFQARIVKIDGKKAKIHNQEQVNDILKNLEGASYTVDSVVKKETKRTPPPPFTTSKLQQEASRRLHFFAKKTMGIAQRLYEGIELGQEGSVGLITYMRTDSVRIAAEALDEARNFIGDVYGKEQLPAKARVFKSSKSSQDAHEAIRPASMAYRPKDIEQHLSHDEFRLYQLIWNRFIASQMNPAVFDMTTITVQAHQYLFRAQGSVMKFPGFTTVYTESKENGEAEAEIGKILPAVVRGETLTLISLDPEQHFTQPPPRFSEATLVRELEENGIGRPSTYANILSTIQDREYARLDKGRFHPTELGCLVNELLVNNFGRIVDVEFTASMEEKLDLIEEGKLTRYDTLKEFYTPFEGELDTAKKEMRNVKREEIPTDLSCDKCGSSMIIKWGKNGKFIACSNYPECKNTRNFVQDENGEISQVEAEVTDTICDDCGRNMVIKQGKFGRFLGCSGYPECQNTKPLAIGVECPQDDCKGYLCERRTKKGKIFFGCSSYPNCTYALWDKPIPEECPQCGHPFLTEKYYRGKGAVKVCPDKQCGYKE